MREPFVKKNRLNSNSATSKIALTAHISSSPDKDCNEIVPTYRHAFSSHDVLLSCKEVMQLLNMTKAGLYKIMSNGTFPRPIRISERKVAWLKSEVTEHLNHRIKQRNATYQYQTEERVQP